MKLFKKTVDIYWTPGPGQVRDDALVGKSFGWQNLLWFEPEPIVKHIAATRIKYNTEYLKCPAFQDYYKNTFVIKSPIDLIINLQKMPDGSSVLATDRYDQGFYDSYILDRGETVSGNRLMSVQFSTLFYSKESVIMEQLNASMETTDLMKNTRCVQGEFDISKWIRPTTFSFETLDALKPLVFKRGDPLFYVRFRTEKKINFIRTDWTEDIGRVVNSMVNVKTFMKNNSLETNYELAKPYIDSNKDVLFKPNKKCPFGFGQK
jgi:hypothetical protein